MACIARTLAVDGTWRLREAAGSQAVSYADESSMSLVFVGCNVPAEYMRPRLPSSQVHLTLW
jgi:hypothetical protein